MNSVFSFEVEVQQNMYKKVIIQSNNNVVGQGDFVDRKEILDGHSLHRKVRVVTQRETTIGT